MLGLNLIHACPTKGSDIAAIVGSLLEELSRARVEVSHPVQSLVGAPLWICLGLCNASCREWSCPLGNQQGHQLPWLQIHRVCSPMCNSTLLQVDLISFSGPTFKGWDNRVAALRLVQKNLCDAALFDPSGNHQTYPATDLSPNAPLAAASGLKSTPALSGSVSAWGHIRVWHSYLVAAQGAKQR